MTVPEYEPTPMDLLEMHQHFAKLDAEALAEELRHYDALASEAEWLASYEAAATHIWIDTSTK